MPTKHTQRFCLLCDKMTMHVVNAPSVHHVVHALLALLCWFVFGQVGLVCWVGLWLVDCVCHMLPDPRKAFRCSHCGAANRKNSTPSRSIRA